MDAVDQRDLMQNDTIPSVECNNWEIDRIYGQLVLSEGYDKKFADGLGRETGTIIDYEVLQDNSARIILCQDTASTLVYWLRPGGVGGSFGSVQYLNIIDISKYYLDPTPEIDGFYPIVIHGRLYIGLGRGVKNFAALYSRVKKDRFWDGSDFDEELDEYVFSKALRPQPLVIGQASYSSRYPNEADVYIGTPVSSKQTAIGDDYFPAGTYEFTMSFIFEDGEIGSMPLGTGAPGVESTRFPFYWRGTFQGTYFIYVGKPDSNEVGVTHSEVLSISATDHNEIYFTTLWIHQDVSKHDVDMGKRIIGINLLMRKRLAGDSTEPWKLIRQIYIDDTLRRERQAETAYTYNTAAKCVWDIGTTLDQNEESYEFKPSSDSGNPYRVHINYYEWLNAPPYQDYLGYQMTPQTMPNYRQSVMFRNTLYVANALYPDYEFDVHYRPNTKNYDIDKLRTDIVYFAVPGFPGIIPSTNFIKVDEEVFGLGATDNYLMIFGKNDLFIYDQEHRKRAEFAKKGTTSHKSIAAYNGMVFWASKFEINMFDRYYPEDITTHKIKETWRAIPLENKLECVGAINAEKNEYVLIIPSNNVLIYNYVTKEWRTKSHEGMISISPSYEDNLLGTASGDAKYVMIYEKADHYDMNGTYYDAVFLTPELTGIEAENMIKDLFKAYALYDTDDDISIQILVDSSQVGSTITLASGDAGSPVQFSLQGLKAENIQLRIKLTTTSNTTKGRFKFLNIYGEISDLKGN